MAYNLNLLPLNASDAVLNDTDILNKLMLAGFTVIDDCMISINCLSITIRRNDITMHIIISNCFMSCSMYKMDNRIYYEKIDYLYNNYESFETCYNTIVFNMNRKNPVKLGKTDVIE